MRKFLIVPALAFALATTAGLAYASSERPRVDAPREQWMSLGEVADTLAAQGYQVRKVETERDGYEVELIDREGRRLEAYVHPVTGEILKLEEDD